MGEAGGRTQRVSNINASWPTCGKNGMFTFLIVTEDQTRNTIEVCPAVAAALIALTQTDTALLCDSDNRTLMAANLVGDSVENG
jgi:hypothetical protein